MKIYTPAVRSKISSKLIFDLQAVCDTPIARITSCVSSLRIVVVVVVVVLTLTRIIKSVVTGQTEDIGRRLPLQLQ